MVLSNLISFEIISVHLIYRFTAQPYWADNIYNTVSIHVCLDGKETCAFRVYNLVHIIVNVYCFLASCKGT